MAAAVSHASVILVPLQAPPAKIAQLLVFGARVLLVDGTYDDAFDLSLAATREFGWYSRNTGFNPFTAEGKKTAAFEIWEWWTRLQNQQSVLLQKKLSIFVSVGDGNIIAGIHKGFKDLLELGWIEQVPRIFGVQAEGAASVARAFAAGTESIEMVNADTLADSISVGLPRDGLRGLRAATQTGGAYVTVSDEQILAAIPVLGKSGVFAEPAGAAAFAGLVQAVGDGLIYGDDPVLVLNTGNGLKDVGAAAQSVQNAPVIEPTIQAMMRIMKQ
jgi:threonine synthase